MGSYLNSDSLFVKIGTTKAVPNLAGEFKTYGELREVELVIDLTTLTSSQVIQSDQEFIPSGVRIEEVEIVAETAATSGGAPTLDIGLIQTDRTTVTSNTAFAAAVALATMTPAGAKQVLRIGSTGVGALVGSTTAQVNHICARANAATYTAGRIVVRIRYMKII
jgi:hypothetical protein